MSLKSVIIAGAACALVASSAEAAGRFVNGSFEDGFTGWVYDEEQVHNPGEANHLAESGEVDQSYGPVDGTYIATIQANFTDTPVVLSQTFTTEGGLFSGSAAFLGEDFLPWNDSGYVRLYRLGGGEVSATSFDDGDGYEQLFYADIAGVGDWGYTPWTRFSIRLGAGTYRVEAGVIDRNDDRETSLLILDDFAMAVPEPGAWALMLTGFFGLGAALRRRRAALA